MTVASNGSTNGTTHDALGYTPDDIVRLTALGVVLTWEDLDEEERLAYILGNPNTTEWYDRTPYDMLATLATFRPRADVWGRIWEQYRTYRGNPWKLQEAVDALRQNAAVTGITPVSAPLLEAAPWPHLADEAYYGLAGDIVRTIAPQTESDPVALLVQLLAMVGNAIGGTPYFPIEADRHYMNLFVCLVGQTVQGRKGTSAGYPRRLLSEIDPAWKSRVKGGLSSGEGIIWHVRDPITRMGKGGQTKVVDEGVSDKRLCVMETEFARGLSKTGQDGNVLSAVLRQAWDHGTLETLVSGRTKAPVNATDAHVSVIAHITLDELQRLLTETEMANGFGNRFLWVCVKRARRLPEGGIYPEKQLRPFCDRLKDSIFTARRVGLMRRSAPAKARWAALYEAMGDGYPGLVGALLAREAPQIVRLSCLYALLDNTATVEVPHLNAAYALWRYCDASTRYIFGSLLGDPLADDILRMLRQMGSEGMTRTDISNALGRNYKSAAIGQALARLLREGETKCTVEKTAGRPLERYFAFAVRTNELNELSPPQRTDTSAINLTPTSTLNSFNSSSEPEMRFFTDTSFDKHTSQENDHQASHGHFRGTNSFSTEGTKTEAETDFVTPQTPSAPPPASWAFTPKEMFCYPCYATVGCRVLRQLDGGEVYLCEQCDGELGRRTDPPGGHPNGALQTEICRHCGAQQTPQPEPREDGSTLFRCARCGEAITMVPF
jgi:hypothetical protein